MTGLDDDPTLPDGAGGPLFDDAELPSVLGGRYTLEERLGAGGGAVVWRAFDEALSRTVAVKVLRPALARDPDAVRRLQREAATAGRVPHPGIVAVYDTGVDEGTAWLALEHVAGPTLLQVLRHHPRGLPPQVAAAVAEQVAVALGHAHARGLVHRDVKPSNLLLTGDGGVKLADFGVATTEGEDRAPELAGSRGYAPPEQLTGSAGDARPTVDVFALGVVLHECLTGRHAFAGATRRAREGGELLAPRQVNPAVPRELDEVVRRATRMDPDERYPDAAALATALRSVVASDPMELTRSLVRPGPNGVAQPAAAPGEAAVSERPAGSSTGRPSWRWGVAAAAVLASVALVTQLALTGGGQAELDGVDGADVGVPLSDVAVFDPYGSIGRGRSSPLAAVDGDRATSWSTPTYPVPLRSLGTPGVGLWIDLGEPRALDGIDVHLGTGDVAVELLATDETPRPGTTEADWRSLDQRVSPGEVASLDAGGTSARYWLVWFTELEPVGESWQAAVTDLTVRPAGES